MPARVLTGLDPIPRPLRRPVVTVGVFDGVHVAHQYLVRMTVRRARQLHGMSVVITFDPDPQLVLDPIRAPRALMPLDERVRHLRALGMDWIWIIPFTTRFARMTAEQFIRRMLINRLGAAVLVVGETFAFGRNRQGNMQLLNTLGASHGMQVVSVPPIRREGAPVSSSRIRQLVAAGRLAQASRLLGRPPALYGTVVRGVGRGRQLGFPTANIRLMGQVLPPTGVYAVTVQCRDNPRRWRGVMNLGVRPTFGPGPLVCEVHLIGFSGTLRGRSVSVSLFGRLRNERCFESPGALARQVHQDLLRARQLFARCS